MGVAGTLIGQRVGDYEVVSRVGTGGMGAVFEAKHPVIGKRVAVKVLHPAFGADPTALERFVNEARVVNAIGHPAVVDIFSFGQTPDGLHYFIMEFLKGRSLADLLHQEGAQPIGRALALTRQLLDVLAKAHAAGVVHRDLKPQNLFVEEGPSGQRLRVLDFGIAKSMSKELKQALTGSAILGTPGYMAPEQINSEPVTPRTDLYAVGAVLFELLTGQPVLKGGNIGQLLIKAIHEDAPRASSLKPDVPAALDAFVAKLLSREPQGRPASAAEALATVQALEGELLATGTAPTRGEVPVALDPHTTNKELAPVPGVDDKATSQARAVRPRVDMHEVGQRTEPEWSPAARRGSSGDDATRPVPKVKTASRAPQPSAPEHVAATAIDRKMVSRMKVEAEAQPGGVGKWVVVALLVAGLGLFGWWSWQAARHEPPAAPTVVPG